MFCGPVVAQIGHLRELLYWLSVFSIGSDLEDVYASWACSCPSGSLA